MLRSRFYILFLVALLLWPIKAQAAEVIHFYLTQINILRSGDLKIKETIVVTAEGEQIKRGIYRDLPTVRHTFLGGVLPVEYKILSIKRDGRDEQYHYETTPGNLRIYIGDASYFLPTGQRYTYEITYTVPKQIFFFEDHDELYWNAIGTGWVFPIEKAGADIIPPKGVPVEGFEVFTGKALSKEAEYESKQQDGHLMVKTTRALEAYEGMTVVVNFPKGSFDQNSSMTGLEFFWQQHHGLQILLPGFALLFIYYLLMWIRMGRDPVGKPIIPQYGPLEGISPAMSAQILTMGMASTRQTLTAAIVSLAAKGFLHISELSKSKYEISRVIPQVYYDKPMSEDEKAIVDSFNPSLVISPGGEALVSTSQAHTKILDSLCKKRFYNNNYGWWFLGMLMYVGVLIAFTAYTYGPSEGAEFWIGMAIWLYTEIIYAILFGILGLFRTSRAKRTWGLLHYILGLAASLASAATLFLIISFISFLNIATIFMMSGLIVIMRHLLRAPTKEGQEVMDYLSGFQYYMEAVEEKVLQKFDPPQMSRELYEKYLPYAIALKVDSKWGEKFAVATAAAATAAGAAAASQTYMGPSWYSGTSSSAFSPSGGFSMTSFTNSIATTISSSSTSSSSGSGGGGSSGGGGGGGGGGGW